MRTPLAWKNLTSSPKKCLLAAMGVGFAVLLMFTQIGFRGALLDSNLQILDLFDPQVANVVIHSVARGNLSAEERFPREILRRARSVPGVQATAAVSLERGIASVQVENYLERPIRVLALELDRPDFLQARGLYEKLVEAHHRSGALVDSESKPFYGFASGKKITEQYVELNGNQIPIVDRFRLGTDFGNDGTLLMSERTFANYFPWRASGEDPLESIDLGLVQVSADTPADFQRSLAQLRQLAPRQVEVIGTRQLRDQERQFWAEQTPIGKIFFIGTLMGLVVGAIICYQIQFTDITEQMSEFATLKAMGYPPQYFWGLILSQSFYLACLGFLPGLLGSVILYQLLATASGLNMVLTWERGVIVFGLTLLMCVSSGALAIRKLFGTDPASLF